MKACHATSQTSFGGRFRPTLVLAVAVVAAVSLVPVLTVADVSRSGLDEERTFSDSGVDYKITYNDTSTSSHRISSSDVDDLEDFAKTSYDRLVDVMNFREPYLSTLPDYEFIVKDDWWYAEPGCVVLDAPSIRNWPADDSRVVFFHERFHTVQRNYKCDVSDCDSGYIGSTFGKWVSEGTADAMMDKGYADLDDKTAYPYYEGSARNFLNAPNTTLFDREYECCLWWNYLMEQLGSTTSEPPLRSRFHAHLLEQGGGQRHHRHGSLQAGPGNRSSPPRAAPSRVSSSISRSATIRGDFDVSGVAESDRYFYVDELTQKILTSVPTLRRGLPHQRKFERERLGPPGTSRATIDKLHRVPRSRLSRRIGRRPNGLCGPWRWTAPTRSSRSAREWAPNSTAAFFNSRTRPIEKICGIAIRFEEGETFDYDFDAGVPKLDIIRPVFAAPAYPGPFDDPGNIVVAVSVTGPAGAHSRRTYGRQSPPWRDCRPATSRSRSVA